MNLLSSGSAAWKAQTYPPPLNYRIDLYVEKVPSPKPSPPSVKDFSYSRSNTVAALHSLSFVLYRNTLNPLAASLMHLYISAAEFLPPWLICMRTLHSTQTPTLTVWGGSRICPDSTFFLLHFFHLNGNACLAAGTGLLCGCSLGIRPIEETSRHSFMQIKFGSELHVKHCQTCENLSFYILM